VLTWAVLDPPVVATHLPRQVQAPVRHGKVEHYCGRGDVTGRGFWLRGVVVLLALGLLAASLACGGGNSETTSTTRKAATTSRTTAATVAISAAERLVGTTVRPTEDTPADYATALGEGRPVVVVFYVPGNADDSKVLEALENLRAEFDDYAFLIYDWKKPDSYGDLPTLLQVDYPPEIILVDRQGVIQRVWNGYVDEGTLRQCLMNIGQG
jgi:hypothetical protein